LEKIGAEASDPRHEIGKVDLAFIRKLLFEMRWCDVLDNGIHPVLCWVGAFDRNQLTTDTENDRRSDLDMNIRCAAVHRRFQNSMKHFHKTSLAKTKDEPNRKLLIGEKLTEDMLEKQNESRWISSRMHGPSCSVWLALV
jgi:hypothetical protein